MCITKKITNILVKIQRPDVIFLVSLWAYLSVMGIDFSVTQLAYNMAYTEMVSGNRDNSLENCGGGDNIEGLCF